MESDSDSQFSVVLEEGGNSGTKIVVEEETEMEEEGGEAEIREDFRAGGAQEQQEQEAFRAGAVIDEDLGNLTLDQNLRRDIRSKTYTIGRRDLDKGLEKSMETEDETREGGGGEEGGGGVQIGERTIQLNSLDNISRFIDEARPSSVERRSGVDAIVVKCWETFTSLASDFLVPPNLTSLSPSTCAYSATQTSCGSTPPKTGG